MHVSITKNCSVSYENYKASGLCVTILWNTYGVNDSYVILTTAQGHMLYVQSIHSYGIGGRGGGLLP